MSHIFQKFVLPHFGFGFCQEVAALPHPPRSIPAVEIVPGKGMLTPIKDWDGPPVPKYLLNKWISMDFNRHEGVTRVQLFQNPI